MVSTIRHSQNSILKNVVRLKRCKILSFKVFDLKKYRSLINFKYYKFNFHISIPYSTNQLAKFYIF